jgi:hypothetical protein
MAKKVFDAVAIVGKYTDRNGQEKKRYLNVGSVFENDKGEMSMKIEAIPAGQDWNGWVSFYVPKERQDDRPADKPKAQDDTGTRSGFEDFADDIPF